MCMCIYIYIFVLYYLFSLLHICLSKGPKRWSSPRKQIQRQHVVVKIGLAFGTTMVGRDQNVPFAGRQEAGNDELLRDVIGIPRDQWRGAVVRHGSVLRATNIVSWRPREINAIVPSETGGGVRALILNRPRNFDLGSGNGRIRCREFHHHQVGG